MLVETRSNSRQFLTKLSMFRKNNVIWIGNVHGLIGRILNGRECENFDAYNFKRKNGNSFLITVGDSTQNGITNE